MSFGSLYKGKRLVKKIFFPRMFIIDFLPHLYREVLFFLCGRPLLGAKNEQVRHDAQKPIEPNNYQKIHEF